MVSGIRVEIRGADRLTRVLRASEDSLSGAVASGLKAGAAIVEGDAKRRVHSPDNPYVGKAGRSVSTGRLQASIGTSDVRGSGIDLEVAVGPPYGKTGVGSFSRSSAATGRTGGAIGRGPRGGRRVVGGRNRSNPNEYAIYEEKGTRHRKGHPFLEPALTENADRIVRAVHNGVAAALERLVR